MLLTILQQNLQSVAGVVPVVEPSLIYWNLFNHYRRRKKQQENAEVSLQQAAGRVAALIERKPQAAISQQLSAAIRQQQELDNQRISTANAEAFLQSLLDSQANAALKAELKAELQRQFDIDEEEALLLLFC